MYLDLRCLDFEYRATSLIKTGSHEKQDVIEVPSFLIINRACVSLRFLMISARKKNTSDVLVCE